MDTKISSMLLAMLLCGIAEAQNPELFSFNPDITPSVETFQIQKHGNLTPSLYTGAMALTIPLYTYHDEDFTIPITLEYNFDGYRPAVHSGTVGYGWALNCGGVITREVRGYPDEANAEEGDSYGYYETIRRGIFSNLKDRYAVMSGRIRADEVWEYSFEDALEVDIYSDQPVYSKKYEQTNEQYDTAADIFHFNFLGNTGEFMLREDGTMEIFNSSIPECELDVEYNFRGHVLDEEGHVGTRKTPEFTISTGDGYKYIFGGVFNAVEYNAFVTSESLITPSAFKLRKIIAPNGNTVEFSYGHHLKESRLMMSYLSYLLPEDLLGNNYHYSSIETRKTAISVFAPPMDTIKVNGKEIMSFDYVETGHDEDANTCYNDYCPQIGNNCNFYHQPPLRLQQIRIVNWSGEQVDNISLEQSFFGNRTVRMFLKGIQSLMQGNYAFLYEASDAWAPPLNDTKSVDYWGFWNGKIYSGSLVGNLNLNNINHGLYNQFKSSFDGKEPDFKYARYGALSLVTYPTGGTSKIQYEQNTVGKRIEKAFGVTPVMGSNFSGNLMSVGGVRVKRIDNTCDGMSDFVEYSYQPFRDTTKRSSGILMYMPLYAMRVDYMITTRFNLISVVSLGFTDECDVAPQTDPIVVYPNVTETFSDGSYNMYTFDVQKDSYIVSDVDYTSIDKIYYTPNTQFVSADNSDPLYLENIKKYMLPPIDDYSRIRGKLLNKSMFDSSGTLMQRESYNYAAVPGCIRKAYFNTLIDYTEITRTWYVPRLSSKVMTRYEKDGEGFGLSIKYAYNSGGQVIKVTQENRDINESRSVAYRYMNDEPGCPQWLKSAISGISEIVTVEDRKFLSSLRKISYDALSGNPNPISMTVSSSRTPNVISDGDSSFAVPSGYLSRMSTFSYDAKYRLVKAEYPGGAYSRYTWDSDRRNIVSKESNSPENVWKYSWKDLVGVTRITYPTTGFYMFEYDFNNRLSGQKDLKGNYMYRYLYHLNNE